MGGGDFKIISSTFKVMPSPVCAPVIDPDHPSILLLGSFLPYFTTLLIVGMEEKKFQVPVRSSNENDWRLSDALAATDELVSDAATARAPFFTGSLTPGPVYSLGIY